MYFICILRFTNQALHFFLNNLFYSVIVRIKKKQLKWQTRMLSCLFKRQILNENVENWFLITSNYYIKTDSIKRQMISLKSVKVFDVCFKLQTSKSQLIIIFLIWMPIWNVGKWNFSQFWQFWQFWPFLPFWQFWQFWQ